MAAALLLLHELPDDALRHIFTHVELPYVLKLACHALRAAGPKRTLTSMKHVAVSKQSLRLAHAMRFPFTWDAVFSCIIAQSGNFDALVWANDVLHIPMDEHVAACAATSGNLPMVQWLHIVHDDVFNSQNVSRAAAYRGQFPVLRWLHSFGMEFYPPTVNLVAEWGDFATFRWLVEVVGLSHGSDCLGHAARGSGMHKNGEHVKIIEYMRNRPIAHVNRWRELDFSSSVPLATLDMLKYMRNDGCDDPLPELTIMHAAEYNRRDVLEWLLVEIGRPYQLCDVRAAEAAAIGGHVELLKWLRERSCPWDYTAAGAAVHRAITHNNIGLLRWMAANGGHIFHGDVGLDQLWRHLKRTPSGPLPDQLVPDAMWVRALMRWRKVKLLVRAWEIVLFWQSEARKRV
jgi:hypothetical protein